jgi:hypothetical protein
LQRKAYAGSHAAFVNWLNLKEENPSFPTQGLNAIWAISSVGLHNVTIGFIPNFPQFGANWRKQP